MLNPFVIKKWFALLTVGMMSSTFFAVGMIWYSFLFGIIFLFVGMVVAIIVATLLLKNPFTMMLEGKGIICFNMDSTGVIRPFTVQLFSPFIRGFLGGLFKKKPVEDVWDRNTVFNLAVPEEVKEPLKVDEKDGEITFRIPNAEYNKNRFALYNFPALIYNEQAGTFLTKEFFAEKESTTFAEHQVIYLNRKVEELTSTVRDFGRYVVELGKPKAGGILQNKWFWIIIIIGALILIGALFLPTIIKVIGGSVGGAASTIKGAAGSAAGAVTPRG